MVLADFEGVVKLQLDPISFKIERVLDKSIAARYRIWFREGFPEPDEGPEPENKGDSTFILENVKINKKSLNRFNLFLMGENLRLIA